MICCDLIFEFDVKVLFLLQIISLFQKTNF
ncbi:hypothetical protein FLBR109950_10625 [Flavobacterium branchiophilum]